MCHLLYHVPLVTIHWAVPSQGNVEHETNVSFLENLANIVLMQRQVEQSVTDPQQPATSLAGEAKTLEFACDKFLAITSEAATLFPSDITKMLHQYR